MTTDELLYRLSLTSNEIESVLWAARTGHWEPIHDHLVRFDLPVPIWWLMGPTRWDYGVVKVMAGWLDCRAGRALVGDTVLPGTVIRAIKLGGCWLEGVASEGPSNKIRS